VSPIRYLTFAFAVCSLAAGACATAPDEEHPIVRMAVFDLNCPRAKLSFTRLSEDSVGATGCGRRVKYVRLCRETHIGKLADEECQWVTN
jgi:hypothetical protein